MKFVPKYETAPGPLTTNYGQLAMKLKQQDQTDEDFQSLYSDPKKPLTIESGERVYYDVTTKEWKLAPKEWKPLEATPGTPAEPKKINFDWSWAPQLLGALNGTISAINSKKNAEKMPTFREQPTRQEYRVTDDYLTQKQYEQAATNTRTLGNQNLSSDLTANLQQKMAYEQQASQYEAQAANLQSQARKTSEAQATSIANANREASIKAANNNLQRDAAYGQMLANAEDAMQKSILTSATEYVQNRATDIFNKHQTDAVNEAYKKDNELKYKAALESQQLYRDYLDKWSDDTKSKQFQQFKQAVINDTAGKFGVAPVTSTDDPKFEQWVLDLWNTSPEARPYKEAYAKEQDQARWNFYFQNQELTNKATLENIDKPFYFQGSVSNYQYTPYGRQTPPSFQKAGGRAQRLKNYQSEIESTRKTQMEANRQRNQLLDRQLERISKEQLTLLKQIFQ